MGNNSILKVKNLKVKLNNDEIIKDLSFEVKKGEFFSILGPNGAGKTTLFRTLLGLIPYKGEIAWSQKDIKIGYLPERLSREKFKEMPISIREFYKFKENSDKKISEMLKSVGLKDPKILDRDPGDLSSGQFQRMLIGWALMGDPQVLFFDEPSTGIDIGGKETVYSLLGKFWQERNLTPLNPPLEAGMSRRKRDNLTGLTILLITHDLDIVYGYSTDVLCLHRKGLCTGPPREVLTPELLEKLYGAKIKFYKHIH